MTLNYVTQPMAEYAFAVKSICDIYNIPQDKLVHVLPHSKIEIGSLSEMGTVKFCRSIPVTMDVDRKMRPEGNLWSNLLSKFSRTYKMVLNPVCDNKRSVPLSEYTIQHKNNGKTEKIRFWEWVGYNDGYPIGSSCLFVEHHNLRKFFKACLRSTIEIEDVQTPILHGGVLKEIYNNSIGFLKDWKTKQKEYKEYGIAYKRGILLCGRPGNGKCINKSTITFSDVGMIPIGDFLSDEKEDQMSKKKVSVYGLNGVEKTSHIYNGGPRKTKRILTRAGFEIEGTENHKIITCDGFSIKWKRLDELKKDDYVAVPRGMNLFGSKVDLSYANPRKTRITSMNENVIIPTKMTNDLAYFMGMLTGDGCMSLDGQILFTTKDLIEKYKTIAKNIFNYTPHQNSTLSKAVDLEIYSVQIKYFLTEIGLTSDKSCSKTIPKSIMEAPKDIVKSYLQGLFDTDGWSELQGYVGFCSCSKKLVKEVQLVLSNFGIISFITSKPNTCSGAWALMMTGVEAQKFYNEIGFKLSRKQDRKKLLSNNFNTNVDILPYNSEFFHNILKKTGPHSRAIHSKFRHYRCGDRKITRSKFEQFTEAVNHKIDSLNLEVARKDIFWDRIKKIENGHCEVADFHVPKTNSFCAGGFINHNTLILKWLRKLCLKENFNYRVVTMEDYKIAASKGQISRLFKMPKNEPGVIFFDDMDVFVKDRDINSTNELHTFLTELDGIESKEGVVFVFTSNIVEQLDEAFVRPGRIDLFLTFNTPSEKLRRRFFEERFHKNILALMPSEEITKLVERTNEYSFAELEEIRKMISIHFINKGEVNVDAVFKLFELHRKEFQERAQFGFNKLEKDDDSPFGCDIFTDY